MAEVICAYTEYMFLLISSSWQDNPENTIHKLSSASSEMVCYKLFCIDHDLSMVFSICQRLPQCKSVKSANAIIVRFRSYADHTLVWESKTRLNGTWLTLSENFDSDTAYNRKKLYYIFKEVSHRKSGFEK